jgi:hypothetical protein
LSSAQALAAGRRNMKRHQNRARAKPKPKQKPKPYPMASLRPEDFSVLRVLVSEMPLVQKIAEETKTDILEMADQMIQLILEGYFDLLVYPDGSYDLTRSAKKFDPSVGYGTT